MPTQIDQPTSIGILLYDDFDSLDVAGPNQVFYFLQEVFEDQDNPVEVYHFVPNANGKVKSLEGLVWDFKGKDGPITYKDYPKDLTLDTIFVPGGAKTGFNNLLEDRGNPFYEFLIGQVAKAKKDKKKQLVTSVCVGSLLLARAGLLNGYNCTTHWAFKNVLSLFPDVLIAPGYPRYVIDRNRVTGGGISSGIDEALAIVQIMRGAEMARKIQLAIQYAPNPPFTGGDPSVANADTLHAVSETLDTSGLYSTMQKLLKIGR